MMKWTKLSKELPSKDMEYCLIWVNNNIFFEEYHICSPKNMYQEEKVWFLPVYNSVRIPFSSEENIYWMPLPVDGWKNFDQENYKSKEWYGDEYLIELHNKSVYVAYVNEMEWKPSFSMFKSGDIESIKKYRELPEKPNEMD